MTPGPLRSRLVPSAAACLLALGGAAAFAQQLPPQYRPDTPVSQDAAAAQQTLEPGNRIVQTSKPEPRPDSHVAIAVDGPAGGGDRVQLDLNAKQGQAFGRLAYSLASDPDGLRASASMSQLRNLPTDTDLTASGNLGGAQSWGLNASYPALQWLGAQFTSTAAYGIRRQLATSHANDKQFEVLKLGLDGARTDSAGADGFSTGLTKARLAVTSGRLDLSAGNASPRTQGQYAKVQCTLSREQRITNSGSLVLDAGGQFAFRNLDPSEKFSMGPLGGVRGNPALDGGGDHGWLVKLEYRQRFSDQLHGAVFFDQGGLSREKSPAYDPTLGNPNSVQVKGAGIGLVWSPSIGLGS